MGIFQSNLDRIGHVIARIRIEEWLTDFILDYVSAQPEERHDVIVKWFGDSQSLATTTNPPKGAIGTLKDSGGRSSRPDLSDFAGPGKDVRGLTSNMRNQK